METLHRAVEQYLHDKEALCLLVTLEWIIIKSQSCSWLSSVGDSGDGKCFVMRLQRGSNVGH